MRYTLFIDDVRFPKESPQLISYDLVMIARSFEDAVSIVENYGCPTTISFDHDLGPGPTGYDFAKWLVEKDLDRDGEFIPEDFSFVVHSANIVGSQNITHLLTAYLKNRKQQSHHQAIRKINCIICSKCRIVLSENPEEFDHITKCHRCGAEFKKDEKNSECIDENTEKKNL